MIPKQLMDSIKQDPAVNEVANPGTTDNNKGWAWHIITQWHQVKGDPTFGGLSDCLNRQGQKFGCAVLPMDVNLQNFRDKSTGASIPTLFFEVINKTDNDQQSSGVGLGSGSDKWSIPLADTDANRWHEFLLHVGWSTCHRYNLSPGQQIGKCLDNGTGFVQLWFDGKEVAPKTSHFTLDEVDGLAYLKQGMYHCSTNPQYGSHQRCVDDAKINNDRTIYHDGMEVVECPANYDDYYNYQTGKCSAAAKLPTSLTMNFASPTGKPCVSAGANFQVYGSLTYISSTGSTQPIPIPGQPLTFSANSGTSITPIMPKAFSYEPTDSSGQYP